METEENISLRGNVWVERVADSDRVKAIKSNHDISETLARVIANRNIDKDGVNSFLAPQLSKDLPDPSKIAYIDVAAKRLADAIEAKEKISIFGDYDVDGATSSSVLSLFLTAVGVPHQVTIPDRDDGYGAEPRDIDNAISYGATLFVTVDCGVSAFAALDYAKEKGLDVIVADHHEPSETLPECVAMVNPKIAENGADNPFKMMAAVGVVFMLTIATSRELRSRGFYENTPEPDLRKYLDLVAFGTICDSVPLSGVNRLFVKSGVIYANRKENIGLDILSEISGIKDDISSYHFGFILGPRINAAGRIGGAELGYKLLTSQSREEAVAIAKKLDELNIRRREIEADVLYQSIEQAEKEPQQGNVLMVHGNGWHQGVIGIVAGRLKERYNMPALVMSVENGIAKGSARSIQGFDLGGIIIENVTSGLLLHGGGHMMAAGFSLEFEKLSEFKSELENRYNQCMSESPKYNELVIDMYTSVAGINSLEFLHSLEKLEPFGEGNPEVVFAIKDVMASNVNIVGNGNVKCTLRGMTDGYINAIIFRAADTEVGQFLLKNKGEPFSVAGKASINRYKGRETAQFVISDIIPGC